VVAIDRLGQATATPTRNLRIDATPPKVTFRLSGSHQRGKLLKIAVKATDASGTGARASGLNGVRISFGDGSRAIAALKAAHRYGHSGHVTVTVTASDKAGNVIAVKRRLTVRK
jgi:hypothetical protein